MSAKSTQEILSSIVGRTKPDLWVKVTGMPQFDPEKHSDGCSGGMSAAYESVREEFKGTPLWDKLPATLPWRECCVVHDKAYYYGGTREEKKAADEALKQCVASKIDQAVLGSLLGSAMQIAVDIGGQPFFKTPYRWRYGEDFRGTEDLPARVK